MATWLWLRSEWKRSWLGLIGLTVVVALVLGATLALWFGARRADTATDRFSEAVGLPNVSVEAVLDDPNPDAVATINGSLEVLPRAATLPGVSNAVAESWWAAIPADDVNDRGPVTPFLVGFSGATRSLPFTVTEGSVDLDDPDAVVVNEAMAARGFGVGSRLPLRTVAAADIETWADNDATLADVTALTGPTIDARVAAVVRVADDLSDSTYPLVAFLPGFVAAHGADVAHVEQSTQLRVEPAALASVVAELQPLYAPHHMVPRPLEDPLTAVRQAVAVEARTLQIAALTVALAGLLLLAQVLARAAARAAAAHPARRALGTTSAELAIGTLLLVLPAIVAGAALGTTLAILASSRFPIGQARRVEPDPGVQTEPLALLAATFLMLTVVVAVAALFARRSARVRSAHTSRSLAVRFVGRPAVLLGSSFAMDPMADARRSRAAAPATVLSVAVAVGSIVTVSTFESSLADVRAHPALTGSAGTYVRESSGVFGAADATAAALAREDVSSLTEVRSLDENSLNAGVDNVQVIPMAFESLKGSGLPAVTSGRMPTSPDEVALGVRTAEQLHASVGEMIELTDITGAQVPLEVVGTVITWSSEGSGTAFIVNTERLQLSACGGQPIDSCNLVVFLFADPEGGEAAHALEDLGFIPTYAPLPVERMGQVGRIPWFLASFLAVLAVLAIINLLAATLRRRRRDLAVARVLGLTPRRSGEPTVWQAGILATLGAALGVVLGIAGGRLLWRILADDLVVLYHPVVGTGLVVAVALGAVVAALAVSVAPAAWATRLRPGAVLRSE